MDGRHALDALGPAAWPLIVTGGVVLVAYADWTVGPEVSVAYLYLLPLTLAAVTIQSRLFVLVAVAVCAALREWMGPFVQSGWAFALRNTAVPATYVIVALLVHRLQRQGRCAASLVRQQRDQLASDLEEAAALQRLLVPGRMPIIAGWDVAARLHPARFVAGDYFDLFWNERDRDLGIVVADVAGKGAAAAMLMPVVQSTVRRQRVAKATPAALARRLNKVVAALTDHPRLVSLVYAVLHPDSGELEYVNMGHPPPLLTTSAGPVTTCRRLTVGGAIAGAEAGARYEVGHERIGEGEVLVLYTDGATEAENPQGEAYGEDRFAELVARSRDTGAAETLDTLSAVIASFAPDRTKADDLTFVAVRRLATESTDSPHRCDEREAV